MEKRVWALVAVTGIVMGTLGRVVLWLVVAMADAAGVSVVKKVVKLVVMSGIWARAELPGVTPMAAVVVTEVGGHVIAYR